MSVTTESSFPESLEVYIYASFSICLELCCGIFATTWTAFYNDKKVDELAYIIFGSYSIFATLLFLYTARELYLRFKPNPVESTTPLRVFVISSVINLAVFLLLLYYNVEVLDQPLSSLRRVENSFKIYGLAVFNLIVCFVASLCPNSGIAMNVTVLAIWLQMVYIYHSYSDWFNPTSAPVVNKNRNPFRLNGEL